jgi:alkyldihydroxyacetonephosphate synthase
MQPTSPIELNGTASRHATVSLPDGFADALRGVCPVVTDVESVADASRDWWPLGMRWALHGEVFARAAMIARPVNAAEVSAVLRACHDAHVPVTAAGGRSGVVGGSAPAFGGVLLDLTALQGILHVDKQSGLVDVLPGTFGPDLEAELRTQHGLTVGHFPQSFELATVGGWVACRGAGQYSTRYGKIEDMVAGLEVALPDGSIVRTGGFPASAQGPDLTHLFLGSEGTLGVVTRVLLRAHPLPAVERKASYSFDSFAQGLDACRRIMRRGATPAVLRLYDAEESQRGQGGDGSECVLLVLDEGDGVIVDATMTVVQQECRTARDLGDERVDKWLHHRNDTSALQALTRRNFVVDTLEIAAPWALLPRIFDEVRSALRQVPHARAATCHLSHSYLDGACLYFTFAATPPEDEVESTYVAMWDAGQRAVLANGGNLSHHHGVGLNRARFVAEALGSSLPLLQSLKDTIDPHGVLNPGKMGLRSPFGEVSWP